MGLGSIAAVLGVLSSQIWPQSDEIIASTATSTPEGLVLYPQGVRLPDDEAADYAESRYLVTVPGLLTMVDQRVELAFSTPVVPVPPGGSDLITVVVGREADVMGWLGGLPYTEVTGLHSWEQLSTAAQVSAGTDGASGLPDQPAALLGNDMWLFERSGNDPLIIDISELPDDANLVLLAAANYDNHPPALTLTWPREVTAPYQWPLIGAGLATILLGAAMLLSKSRHAVVEAAAPAPAELFVPEVPVPATHLGTGIYVNDADDTFWDEPEPAVAAQAPAPPVEIPSPAVEPVETPTPVETPVMAGVPELIPEPTLVVESTPEISEPAPVEQEHWATYRPSRPVLPPLPDLLAPTYTAVLPDDETPSWAEPERLAIPPLPIVEPEPITAPVVAPVPAPVTDAASGLTPVLQPEPEVVESEPEPVVIEPVTEQAPVSILAAAPQGEAKPKRSHRFSLRRRSAEPKSVEPTAPESRRRAAKRAPVAPVAPTPVVAEPVAPTPVEQVVTAPAESAPVPVYTPPVSRSALREARRVAEETGDTEMLDSLTGVIQAVPEPEALTSQIPISTANWRAVWGLENTSRRARRTLTGEVEAVSGEGAEGSDVEGGE